MSKKDILKERSIKSKKEMSSTWELKKKNRIEAKKKLMIIFKTLQIMT